MIPGGFAGMKYLHKLGLLAKERSLQRIEMKQYCLLKKSSQQREACTMGGTEMGNDEYYEQVILNRSNTLTREQVLDIRKYANEWHTSIEIIASLTGASVRQIRDVLSDKYYSRVQ